ncbi:MAG: DUF4199 domain-containing protein [Bacteroidota bacterium]
MSPLIKVSLRYGVIAGLLGTGLVIGLYYLDRHPFLIPVYMDFRVILFAVFMFFTLKEIRDYYYGGVLYFWQGVISSFLFVATFALSASAGIWIFAKANSEFVSSYIKMFTDYLKAYPPDAIQQIGKATYERNLALLPSTNAFDLASLYFGQSFLIGFFVSIILSVILRRQPKH